MPLRSSKLTRFGGLTLLALLTAVLAGCSDNTASILDPHGPIASQELNLFWFILVVATLIFVLVMSALVYSIFRFRSRPNGPDARQIQGNSKLEIAWTVIPSVVLFGVLAATIFTMFGLAQPSAPNTLTVTAIGHQWWWEFQYPDAKMPNGTAVVTGDELHIPTNTVVHVDLRSNNVIHSMWVPELSGKTDVIPGHNNSLWLKADTAGSFRGECTEFCGVQHAHMDFVVIAQSPSDYQAWITGQQQYAAQVASGVTAGRKEFLAAGCAGCHLISDGKATANNAQIGPNLTHFGSRALIAGGVVANTTDNLHQWIYNAQTIKDGSDMPAFDGSDPLVNGGKALTSQQLDDLVTYLQSLK